MGVLAGWTHIKWRVAKPAGNRRTVMSASFLVVSGRLQRASDVIHVVAERFVDLSARLAELKNADGAGPRRRPSDLRLQHSRDFH